MEQTTTQFQVGKTYATRSVCDSECIISKTIARRTAKTIVTTEGKSFRVSLWRGVEQFKPWGSYSMAPILSADKEAANMSPASTPQAAPIKGADWTAEVWPTHVPDVECNCFDCITSRHRALTCVDCGQPLKALPAICEPCLEARR